MDDKKKDRDDGGMERQLKNEKKQKTNGNDDNNNTTVVIRPIETINDKQLSVAVQKFLNKKHIEKPTEVQQLCWPAMLNRINVVAVAPTGSGKTLGFLLPLVIHIEKVEPKVTASGLNQGPIALILAPTRELAIQITHVAKRFKRLSNIKTVCVCGGIGKEEQIEELKLATHIVVATPGRLIDLLSIGKANKPITLHRLQFLIFDEADRMLELGFEEQLKEIYNFILNLKRSSMCSSSSSSSSKEHHMDLRHNDFNTCMFTATLPKRLNIFVNSWIQSPRIDISTKGTLQNIGNSQLGISPTVTQVVHVCAEHKKPKKLIKFLKNTWKKDVKKRHVTLVLVFCNKIKTVIFVEQFLRKQNIKVAALHGKIQQHIRTKVLNDFKAGKTNVLIATDVAARGLHMKHLEIVVNWDMPSRLEQYVHRVGRTGRQGQAGLGYTFFTRNFAFLATELIELLKSNEQVVDPNLQLVRDEYVASGENDLQSLKKKKQKKKSHPSHGSALNYISKDEEILMVPTSYSDGSLNLATLPIRSNIDDVGWTSSSDSEIDNEDDSMSNKTEHGNDLKKISLSGIKRDKNTQTKKATFADGGKLRGVSFKDRCWMAGIQAKTQNNQSSKITAAVVSEGVSNNTINKGNKKRKGKWKKRGKRGGKKHKKK